MSSPSSLSGVIRQLPSHAGESLPDAELLACYARQRDEAAFATVVRRYGGLVLGVARRQLGDPQQADDVFQATFLALARSADRLRRETPLANWLYTVSLRQARKVRARAARRTEVEQASPPPPASSADPLAEITGRELLRVIDEELARLPERYRLPVLLCCVQGLSREEAAGQLGWSDGSVKGRLERGRRLLADRLAARGLAPSAIVIAPLAAVVVPAELVARTAPLAAAPWSKAVPPAVAALAATVAPRRLLSAVACSLVVVGIAGWVIAFGENRPVAPAAPSAAGRAEPAAGQPDDPLPAGSTLRFGTTRFRHGTEIANLAVSADGKLAVAGSGGHVHGAIRGFDLSDGRVLYTLPELHPYPEAVGLSPDGKTLAVKVQNSTHLFDAITGQPIRKVELPNTSGGTLTYWITFTPDGKSVALTQGNTNGVVLVDLRSGTTRLFPHNNTVYAAAFSPDGTRMAAGGYDSEKGMYVTRLWDVATAKELRHMPHRGGLRTVTFSPDSKTLAGGGDGGWARVWDADTGKEVLNLPSAGYRVRSVAFSPDGRTLAAAGDVIRLYDAVTGKERGRIERQAIGLRFSPDGTVLTAAVTGTIHRWDAATLRPLTPQAAGESAVDQILVTADGLKVITRGQDGDAHVWDARTGAHIRHVKATWQRGIALSPDGRFLVWPVEDEKVQFKDPARPNAIHTGSRLRLYDLRADAFVERFPGFEGDAQDLYFTPEGRTLLTVDHRDGKVRLWDVATGKVQRSFGVVPENKATREHFVWHAVLSPDGRTLAVTYQSADEGGFPPYVVRLWDVASGKASHELAGHLHYITMAFSPDSRTLVTASPALQAFAQQQLNRSPNQVYVWDVGTGQRVGPLPDGLPAGAVAAAFSPDGRTLATATPDGTIQLWEVVSWTVRAEFRGHRDRVNSLTFTPDGRLLSGGLDTTVLAWDVRPPRAAGDATEATWQDLAKPEGRAAFQAQGRLLASPAEAVRLIAANVKPVGAADAKRVAALVADLDSAEFATRERAARELGEVGPPAAAALREALKKSESAEVRKRVAELLAKLERPILSPDEVRALRAVEVLEWVGGAEAREVLAALAKGDPGARLTQAAAAALRR
jgi:RNA polymerase sigma factor (sigma-70 family)